MNIQQPTIETKIPDEVRKATETARENLIILQADGVRLNKAKATLDRAIITANEALADVTDKISKSETKLDGLTKDISSLQNHKQEWEDLKLERDKKYQESLDIVTAREIAVQERENVASENEAELTERSLSITLKEKLLEEQGQELTKKAEAIKKLSGEL